MRDVGGSANNKRDGNPSRSISLAKCTIHQGMALSTTEANDIHICFLASSMILCAGTITPRSMTSSYYRPIHAYYILPISCTFALTVAIISYRHWPVSAGVFAASITLCFSSSINGNSKPPLFSLPVPIYYCGKNIFPRKRSPTMFIPSITALQSFDGLA